MGVLTLQLLVCGQLILFSLVVANTTDLHQATESPLKLTNTSEIKPSTTSPLWNTTGNYTENNALILSSNSTFNSSKSNMTTSASLMNHTGTQSTTLQPQKDNVTVIGSTIQPNTTTAHTSQSSTSAYRSTISTNSTTTSHLSQHNTTYSSTTKSTTLMTSVVTNTTVKAFTTVAQNNSTNFTLHSLDSSLSLSEKWLTIFFSVLLGVFLVIILMYLCILMHKFSIRKQARVQYTHRRLQNEDTGEQFTVSDDTLVISGGLYDGPQIYNPTMTVQNEDSQADASGFPYRPTHFRLEFLRDESGTEPDHDTSTFQTFHGNDQDS